MPALRIDGYVIVSADGMLANAAHVMPDELKFEGDKRFFTSALDPSNSKATLWNPSGAAFEAACEHAGVRSGSVAIIGGPDVFGMFMDRYDTFWLSQAPRVRLPGGEPCFPGVPARSPEAILAAHGLKAGDPKILDRADDVTVTPWRRVA